MNKIKKDFIVFYLIRNAVATFLIAGFSFCYSLINYYQITFLGALKKIFIDNFYTTVYFLLLWIFNYLLFEIYKTIVVILKSKKIGKIKILNHEIFFLESLLPLFIMIVLLVIDFNQLFKINFVLLMLFMIARSIKEIIKDNKK
ncbi:hypothetical protein [Thomasclavelia sp.]|uniref:hypothetical protein n=1 Tax=Thomasclavelia sp. TaxID=3025757 RepID=UPI0025E0B67F|nr:hypothetical protein [Thomasclavelia sp.]